MTPPVNPPTDAFGDAPDPAVIAHRLRLREEEYAALRATIRERGTRRMALVVVTVASWAAFALLNSTALPTPGWALVPLMVLAAGFEAGFVMHVGVERIGRYLQVEYEDAPSTPRWEHAAMRFGSAPAPAGGRTDPLFSALFIIAVALNVMPAVLWFVPGAAVAPARLVELGVVALGHLALVVRILRAKSYAGRQRALDLAALSRSRSPEVP